MSPPTIRRSLMLAAQVLEEVEAASPALESSGSRCFLPRGREAHVAEDGSGTGVFWAATSADRIRLADVSTDARKFRAFYARPRPRTVAVKRPGRGNLERAVTAYRKFAPHVGFEMPSLLDRGSVTDNTYLVETLVPGWQPAEADERHRAARTVLPLLLDAYASFGISTAPLADHVRVTSLLEGLEAFTETVDWLRGWPSKEAFLDMAHALLGGEQEYPFSFSHRDLSFTNVLVTPRGIGVVDWEHAGTNPIAFDVAKLVSFLQVDELTRIAFPAVVRRLGDLGGPGVLPAGHQLAAGLLEKMRPWPRHRAEGGSARFEQRVQRYMELFASFYELERT